jgi:hypothetical protein
MPQHGRDSFGSGQNPQDGFCELGIESYISVSDEILLDQLGCC